MYRGSFGRKDRLVQEKRHDVYRSVRKLQDDTICADCGAVYAGGRWTWSRGRSAVTTVVCPACQRVQDRVPAGSIDLSGSFVREHRSELLGLIRNVESAEKKQHPMERIMEIDERDGKVSIRTTGVHIARRIGDAVRRSYRGELSYQYAAGAKRILVNWVRDG